MQRYPETYTCAYWQYGQNHNLPPTGFLQAPGDEVRRNLLLLRSAFPYLESLKYSLRHPCQDIHMDQASSFTLYFLSKYFFSSSVVA